MLRYTPTICHSIGGPSLGDAGNELLDEDPLRERVDICHVASREGLVDERDRLRLQGGPGR